MSETWRMTEATARMDGATAHMNHTSPRTPHAGASTAILQSGCALPGGYVITGMLSGRSGEATIYTCEQQGKVFVAKLYHEDTRPKPEIVEKVKTVNSPYIIKILDSGHFGERYFEILPFFRNGDLRRAAPLDESFILGTVVRCLHQAIHTLHQAQIVHRDIKPQNVFFSEDKSFVILGDFGISSLMPSDVSVRVTTASKTLGYAPPEAYLNLVTEKSDYYALGVTLLHLYTGMDPFHGMSEAQIYETVMTKKLPIPERANPRLSQLIQGLTLKDPEDRWGFEDVERWLRGEHVEVVYKPSGRRPYTFQGQELYEREDVAMAFALNWEEGKKRLYRGLVQDFAKQFDEDLLSRVMDCEEIRHQDLGLFHLIYVLHPDAPLCWRGECFRDLRDFAAALGRTLPDVDGNYVELLRSGALAHYMRIRGYDHVLTQRVEELQNLAINDVETAYFRLVYLLSERPEFVFQNQRFASVDDFVLYLASRPEELNLISRQVLQSKQFFAWLHRLGYGDMVEAWRKIQYHDDER